MFPVLLPFCLLSSPNVQLVPASALKLHPSITAIIFCDNFLFTALYSPPMKQQTLSSYVQHVKEEKSWQYVTVLAVIEFSVLNTKRLILIAGFIMGTDKDFRRSLNFRFVSMGMHLQ